MTTKDDLMKKYNMTEEEAERLIYKLEIFASFVLARFKKVASDFKRITQYNHEG